MAMMLMSSSRNDSNLEMNTDGSSGKGNKVDGKYQLTTVVVMATTLTTVTI